jgi:hypothetical protein
MSCWVNALKNLLNAAAGLLPTRNVCVKTTTVYSLRLRKSPTILGHLVIMSSSHLHQRMESAKRNEPVT